MRGQPISRQRWLKARKISERGIDNSPKMNILRTVERWPTFRPSVKGMKPLVLNQLREMMAKEEIGNIHEGTMYLRQLLKDGTLTMNDLIQMKFKFAGVGTMNDWQTVQKMTTIDRMIEAASGHKIPPKYKTKKYKDMNDFYMHKGRL